MRTRGNIRGLDAKIVVAHTDMMRRCYNEKCISYPRYGARGIIVCEEWHDLAPFKEWCHANGIAQYLSLDRIDVNGNYEPSNCRWATDEEQYNNRRSTHRVTLGGETLLLKEWSRRTNISLALLRDRIFVYGWSPEKALTTPAGNYTTLKTIPRAERIVGKTSPEEAFQAVSLAAEGYSYTQIAKMMGRSADWARRQIDPKYRLLMNEKSKLHMRSKYVSRDLRKHEAAQ